MSTLSFLFAPGAGAPSTSPWMMRFRAHFEKLGKVHAFDYPYQRAGRRYPDRLPTLIAAHEQAIAELAAQADGPLVLVGKSMGSRVGCHASLTTSVSALVNLGYPLVAAGKSGAIRDDVLKQLRTPALFVQGTRDPLCPLELLTPILQVVPAVTELYVVETGDHSLECTRTYLGSRSLTQEQVEQAIMDRVERFLADVLSAS